MPARDTSLWQRLCWSICTEPCKHTFASDRGRTLRTYVRANETYPGQSSRHDRPRHRVLHPRRIRSRTPRQERPGTVRPQQPALQAGRHLTQAADQVPSPVPARANRSPSHAEATTTRHRRGRRNPQHPSRCSRSERPRRSNVRLAGSAEATAHKAFVHPVIPGTATRRATWRWPF